MICTICDEAIFDSWIRMFGGYAHEECDIESVRERLCEECWLIHAGECW